MEGYTEAVELELARLRAELKRAQGELAATRAELDRTRDALVREVTRQQPGSTAKAA